MIADYIQHRLDNVAIRLNDKELSMVKINKGKRESLISIYKNREILKKNIDNILRDTGVGFSNPEFDCIPNAQGELVYDIFYHCNYHKKLLPELASIASLMQSKILPSVDSDYTAKNSTAIHWYINNIRCLEDSIDLAKALTDYSNNYKTANCRGRWRIGKITEKSLIFYLTDTAREFSFPIYVFYKQAVEAQKINSQKGIPDYHRIFCGEGDDFIYNSSKNKNNELIALPSNFEDLSLNVKNKLILNHLGYRLYDGETFNKISTIENKIEILKKINSLSNRFFCYRPFTAISITIKKYIKTIKNEFEYSRSSNSERQYDLRFLMDKEDNVVANVMLNNRVVEYLFVDYHKNPDIPKGVGTFLLSDLLANLKGTISGSFIVKPGYNGENIEHLIKGCGFAAATRLPNCEMLPQFTQDILGFPNGFMFNAARVLEDSKNISNTSKVYLTFNCSRNN